MGLNRDTGQKDQFDEWNRREILSLSRTAINIQLEQPSVEKFFNPAGSSHRRAIPTNFRPYQSGAASGRKTMIDAAERGGSKLGPLLARVWWKTAEPRSVIVHVSGCLLARTRYLHFRYPVITSRIPVCLGTLFCPGGGATQRRACNPIKASRRRLRRCCCCCCSLDGAKASCFYTRPLRMEPLSLFLPCFLTPPWFLWSFRCWFSRSSTAYVTSAQRAPCNFFYDLPRFSTLWAGPSPRDCNLIRSRATSWNRWS